jgi:hypothetical protein
MPSSGERVLKFELRILKLYKFSELNRDLSQYKLINLEIHKLQFPHDLDAYLWEMIDHVLGE